jgi:hypothetical protein
LRELNLLTLVLTYLGATLGIWKKWKPLLTKIVKLTTANISIGHMTPRVKPPMICMS